MLVRPWKEENRYEEDKVKGFLFILFPIFFLPVARITRVSYINRQRSKRTTIRSGMIFEAIISSGLDRDVMAAPKDNVVLGQKQMYFFWRTQNVATRRGMKKRKYTINKTTKFHHSRVVDL